MSCLFCRIVAGEIPATVVFDYERVLAFRDIAPVAPTHIVVIPKSHFSDVAELTQTDPVLAAELFAAMAELGQQEGADGYRLVFNTGRDAGQSVAHVHGHVLAGRNLNWPPG